MSYPLELVARAAEYLAAKGVEDARLSAELLLADALGCQRLDLYLRFDRPVAADELEDFRARVRRRSRREPMQYIAGEAAFRELVLKVDRRVLIPRPETELLVGEVITWARGRPGLDVVDVGTGSGAIALSLRSEGSFARVVATDVSAGALEVAQANRERTLPEGQVEFRRGFLLEPLAGDQFDVIVSNPPYVAAADRRNLPPEVRDWEPGEALFGGADGLDLIRQIVRGAPAHLRPGGLLALEIGADQAAEVARMVGDTPTFGAVIVKRDLAGRDRMIFAERT